MSGQELLLTGFGAFEEVSENPSGWLAQELHGHALARGKIAGARLPVSFERGPDELEALIARVQPFAVLAMGVHPGDGFRIERGAGVGLAPDRPDADGVDARNLPARAGERMSTGLDVERLKRALTAAVDGEVEVSDDAGRYVCECVYRRALEIGSTSGTPTLFLHVPSFDRIPREQQRTAVLALVADLVDQAVGAAG